MSRWEPIVMAGLGAAAAQIDPNLKDPLVFGLNMAKAFVGAAVGAYFGNHISEKREKKKDESDT